MTIVRFDPFTMLNRQFFRPMMDEFDTSWPTFKMTDGIDVYEEGDKIVVKAAVPGIDAEKVQVTFEDGVLHVSAREEEREEDKDKKKTVYKKERITMFDYVCTLPRPIDAKELTAEVEKGVLIVTAPIAPEAKPHSVPVRVRK
jgi:HSP20 family protein